MTRHIESPPGVGEDGLTVTDPCEMVWMVAGTCLCSRGYVPCAGATADRLGLAGPPGAEPGAVAVLPTLTAVCTSLAGLGTFAVDCLLGRPLLLFLGKKSGQVPGPSVSGQPNPLGCHDGKWGLALRQALWEPKAVAGIEK